MTQPWIDEVAQFADTAGGAQLMPIIDRLRRPVRVAVVGRQGVGRGMVESALRRRGVTVGPPAAGEVCVLVIAETAKAEDLAAVRSTGRPVLMVLTKADLAGAGPGGPMAVARRRASAVRAETATPTVPMVGLLSALDPTPLDDALICALRAFADEPPDLAGVDAFVEEPHGVGRDVRVRLLDRFDRFGIAHAILALAGGMEPDRLPAHLARLGNVEEVLSALDATAAPVRYRRTCAAVAELRCLGLTFDDARLTDLMASDSTAMAVMTAAVDVVEAEGLSVDRGDTAAAHLARAIEWRRYGRGPVNALHLRCSADITRGSLRLLQRSST